MSIKLARLSFDGSLFNTAIFKKFQRQQVMRRKFRKWRA